MPQAHSAALADILDFEGMRAIGEPTKFVVRFTHEQHDLSRTDYLNKAAALLVQPRLRHPRSRPEPEHRVHGVVTGFALLKTGRDQSTYEVVLESRLALLRNTPKCRFFLDRSIPEIIRQILREHGFDQLQADFELALTKHYRKSAFVMQWEEDDLAFITRLCRRTGIWFVCEAGKHCERVRFCDDLTHYRRDAALDVPYLEHGNLDSGGAESVQTLAMYATTVPKTHSVRTYNPEQATSDTANGEKTRHGDETTYGEAHHWGTPGLMQQEAEEEANLRHEAAMAAQVEYRGTGDVLDLSPAAVLKLSNRELPDAPHGLLAVRVICRASRTAAYTVEFTAMPAERLYRLPLREQSWPRIDGVITGTIAAPDRYVGPYLDEQGRYTVHLHPDRDERVPGLESCPMRLAKPFAGAGQTGFHFGLVEGTVVTVGFLWGNPDLPYISQVLHTAEATDPIVAGYPWGTRNTLRTRTNNTLQMDDRDGCEHIKVATEHGNPPTLSPNLLRFFDHHIHDSRAGFRDFDASSYLRPRRIMDLPWDIKPASQPDAASAAVSRAASSRQAAFSPT
ncbi:type VI secretion system Vgr family protein [Pandoraea norimbergensis]|uniref:Type VI secretion system tip protein VgrG n=1 Tax=Pandoraea norimbergensis TaxID=93219 RepID=A0ABN4JD85_9BURK|nr:type VI secretion system tip protein VgrG [Pandoraea norimbergensis]ALS58950.1 hypothetical protein AT302_03305 [Pandoraea norimbergensis]